MRVVDRGGELGSDASAIDERALDVSMGNLKSELGAFNFDTSRQERG